MSSMKEKIPKIIGCLLMLFGLIIMISKGLFILILYAAKSRQDCDLFLCSFKENLDIALLLTAPLCSGLVFIIPGMYMLWKPFKAFVTRNKLTLCTFLFIWGISVTYVLYLTVYDIQSTIQYETAIKSAQTKKY